MEAPRGPMDNRPPSAGTLARSRVTAGRGAASLLRVSKWPVQEFNRYLEAQMEACGIADRAELSRRAGLDQTQLSNWRRGKASPSRGSLRKVADVLGVPPINLYIVAGLDSAQDLGLTGEPDLAVMPPELRELIDLYQGLDESDRSYLRRHIRVLIDGMHRGASAA